MDSAKSVQQGIAGEGAVAPGSVAVSFDDGYLSNLRLAKPILERCGIPASVFVTSGMTGGAHDFWWNPLAEALLRLQ